MNAPYTTPVELQSIDVGETHDVAAAHPDIAAKFEAYIRMARTDSPDWPIPAQPPPSNKDKKIPAAL